jgi:hypothetical protein
MNVLKIGDKFVNIGAENTLTLRYVNNRMALFADDTGEEIKWIVASRTDFASGIVVERDGVLITAQWPEAAS